MAKYQSLVDKVKENPEEVTRELINVTDRVMQGRKATWDRYRRKYRRGLYYLNETSGVPLYFTNYIFSIIEAAKAHIVRHIPPIVARPKGKKDDEAAEIMNLLLTDALERTKIRRHIRHVVHYGLLATMGWFKVAFDPDDDMVKVIAISPEDVLVDPLSIDPQEARWVIHRIRDVSLDEIYATYDTSLESDKEVTGHDRLYETDNLKMRDGTYMSRAESSPSANLSPVCDVYECWIRDFSEDSENNWYIVTIADIGNGKLLREEYSVYEHNKVPIVPWFDTEDAGADNVYYMGVGMVEEIEPLQDRADALDLKIYRNISLTTNRQKYIRAGSGLNINTMDSTPGRAYEVNGEPSKAVHFDSPPQLSHEVMLYRNQTDMLIQTVSGVMDVTQGRRPVGITAGRAIESLKDSAEARIDEKLTSLGESLEKVGSLVLQIILQFYDVERMVQATDVDEEKDYVVIGDYPPALEEKKGITDNERIELREQRREYREQNGISMVLSDVSYEWDVKASTESALPNSRAERGQIAADLFRLGVIDRLAALQALDYPDRHKIIQRLEAAVTGKNAGDPAAEGTAPPEGAPPPPPDAGGLSPEIEQILMQVIQALQQMGIPEEQIGMLIQQVMQGGQAPQEAAPPQQGGNFPPQVTI